MHFSIRLIMYVYDILNLIRVFTVEALNTEAFGYFVFSSRMCI